MKITKDGIVSQLLKDTPIPRMFRAEQSFSHEHIEPQDIPAALLRELEREEIAEKIQPGMRIAITAGSLC